MTMAGYWSVRYHALARGLPALAQRGEGPADGIFLCGITSILGVIFGFVGLSQTKNNARPGRGLALAGVIIGGIVVLAWVAIFVAAATSKNGCVHFGTGPTSC